MKTISRIFIFIFILTALTATNLNAGNSKTGCINKILQKVINYPDFARDQNLEGVVLVSFKINEDASLTVNLTNESNITLKDYIVNKLKKIKILPSQDSTENNIIIKFEFKLKCSFYI